MKQFGQRLRSLREKYLPDMSRNRAAQIALLSYSQLKKIEEGKGDPQLSTIIRLAQAWHVPLEDFFIEEKTKKELTGVGEMSIRKRGG